jgi:glycosyltransferase involved in cell wall biosynthesis
VEYLKRLGHEARLYVGELIGQHPDVELLRNSDQHSFFLRWLYYLRFLRAAGDCDILHGHYAPPLLALKPDRSILHLHGLGIAWLPHYHLLRKRYRRATYIACAHHVRRAFLQRYPDLPEERVHVVHNGVDLERFRPLPSARDDSVFTFCFCAGWIPEKGIFELLQAVRILEARRQDFRVLIAGSAFGHYAKFRPDAEIQKLDQDVRDSARGLATVEFVGQLDQQHVASLYQSSHVGIVPSVYEDPFPLVPLEMMASGLPVIAFRTGGVVEMIEDGTDGMLVDNRDTEGLSRTMERCLADTDDVGRFAQAARQTAEVRFSWAQHAARLVEIYTQLA